MCVHVDGIYMCMVVDGNLVMYAAASCVWLLAAQRQLEGEMQQQQKEGQLLHGNQLAEFSRLEAEASAKTSKAKTALDTLATTQQARLTTVNTCWHWKQCVLGYLPGIC